LTNVSLFDEATGDSKRRHENIGGLRALFYEGYTARGEWFEQKGSRMGVLQEKILGPILRALAGNTPRFQF
jgi:hypothetical protein